MDGLGEGGDLVVVALPGVQRFIAEARSTADVSAASEIYSALAERVVNVLRDEAGGDLVLARAQRFVRCVAVRRRWHAESRGGIASSWNRRCCGEAGERSGARSLAGLGPASL